MPGPISPWHDYGGPYRLVVEASALFDDPGLWAAWDVARWDENTWASTSSTWTDVTAWVTDVTITRGRDRWDQRVRAGTARITVDNTSGTFTPDGPPNPNVMPWRPGRTIRVSVDHAVLGRLVLFVGTVDDSTDVHAAAGYDVSTVIAATDPMGDWQRSNPVALGVATGVQRTDQRVAAALNRLPDPPTLHADTGAHTMQTSYLAQSTLEECQRAAEAEGGAFWADTNGDAVFRNRDWLTTDPISTTVQASIGQADPDAPELAPLDFTLQWSTSRIRNHITLARAGGTAQTATDGVSVALYGARSWQRMDLLANTDIQVADLAARYLARWKDNRAYVSSVDVAVPDTVDGQAFFAVPPFGARVAVHVGTPHGWSVDQLAHVHGYTQRITRDDWQLRLTLDQIPPED